MGMRVPLKEFPVNEKVNENYKPVRCEPIPINKVGDYCKGKDENTTLPIEFNEIKSLAILDSGVVVAIVTKKVWEAWGKPALKKTRMKLQLENGYIK